MQVANLARQAENSGQIVCTSRESRVESGSHMLLFLILASSGSSKATSQRSLCSPITVFDSRDLTPKEQFCGFVLRLRDPKVAFGGGLVGARN